MFDRDALNNKWIEAKAAYQIFEEHGKKCTDDYPFRHCGHPDIRIRKDGGRDRRWPCKACETDADKSRDVRRSLYWKWSEIWDLFDEIGMDMKEER